MEITFVRVQSKFDTEKSSLCVDSVSPAGKEYCLFVCLTISTENIDKIGRYSVVVVCACAWSGTWVCISIYQRMRDC